MKFGCLFVFLLVLLVFSIAFLKLTNPNNQEEKLEEVVQVVEQEWSYDRHHMLIEDYLRIIKMICEKFDFPHEDIVLALLYKESDATENTEIKGKRGERGPWQIMERHFKRLAKKYGKEYDWYDPIDNCEVAVHLLKENIQTVHRFWRRERVNPRIRTAKRLWENTVIMYSDGFEFIGKDYSEMRQGVKDVLDRFIACHKKAKETFPSKLEFDFRFNLVVTQRGGKINEKADLLACSVVD